MFSFIFTTGILHGQKDTINYIDSDVKGKIIQTSTIDPRLGKPDLNFLQKSAPPTIRYLDRFWLYQDSLFIKYDTVNLSLDFVLIKEFSGTSRFYSTPLNGASAKNEKSILVN